MPAPELISEQIIAANERSNRRIRLAVYLFLAACLTLQVVSNLGTYRNTQATRGASALLVDCTTPSTPDEPHECWDRLAGVNRPVSPGVIEVDCRARRLDAGLPSPDPSSPCVAQTDPSIFPGAG